VRWLRQGSHVDPHKADAMNISDAGQAAVALLGVIICTKVFTSAARRMGWGALAVRAVLSVAGHLASGW
jgi:hypothetical protein